MTPSMDSPVPTTPTLGVAPQPRTAQAGEGRFIYIAVPWTPLGGGMYKVADYLIQAQQEGAHGPVLRPLDTRGSGSAAGSLVQAVRAVGQLVRARIGGSVAGVHVNMAERLDFVRESLVLVACKLLGIPAVLHLHAAQLHHSYRRFPAPLRALVRWIFSLPQCCVVLGQVSADFVTRELHVPPQRVEIVINGVPEPQVARRARTPAVPRLLFVGNLSDRKGVPELLEALAHPALAKVPLHLTLAGGGDIDGYAERARALGVDGKVRFHGWADQGQVAQLLADADALVLPSHDEGLPLAILEALAHGVAVVCTPVGEIPHVLSHGHSACFVEPGEPASIARGLAQVLGEAQLRERLERKGKALHQAQFSLRHFATSIARIHQRQFGLSAQLPPAAEEQRP
ncbi:MAG: glycosyltransferase family 4 protein [Ramlibacter sp.]